MSTTPPKPSKSRVPRACLRCRRQKLKVGHRNTDATGIHSLFESSAVVLNPVNELATKQSWCSQGSVTAALASDYRFSIRFSINQTHIYGCILMSSSIAFRWSLLTSYPLQCDPFRPCALCVRSDVECKSAEVDPWRPFEFAQHEHGHSHASHDHASHSDRPAKKRKHNHSKSNSASDASRRGSPGHDEEVSRPSSPISVDINQHDGEKDAENLYDRESSTLGLTKEAFIFNNSSEALQPNLTSAFPGGERTPTSDASPTYFGTPSNPLHKAAPTSQPPLFLSNACRWRKPRASIAELVALLPSPDDTRFLVDTYFDKVHWFKMAFHQETFRAEYERLANMNFNVPNTDDNFSFVCVLLLVIALAAPYGTEEFGQITPRYPIVLPVSYDIHELIPSIMERIKSVFLDIVSVGNLSSLHVCILLGSHCLFQGDPSLAWMVIGCGIRIAQALGLHRAPPKGLHWLEVETRRRAWCTIYAYDRVTAMMYGRPLGLADADCDVSPPDEFVNLKLKLHLANGGKESTFRPENVVIPDGGKLPGSVDEEGFFADDRPATLLSYQVLCFEMYHIIGDTLNKFYGRNKVSKPSSYSTTSSDRQTKKTRFQRLLMEIKEMDRRLKRWWDQLPRRLKLEEHSKRPVPADETPAKKREYNAFQLQALALQLAYENAIILLHRPLLTYKLTHPIPRNPPPPLTTSPNGNGGKKSAPHSLDPFTFSADSCLHASLRTSKISSHPIFEKAQNTDAVAYMGVHLFTSGVILCLTASQDPLSVAAVEAKAGVQRILTTMNSGLGRRSVVVEQGARLLKELIGAVLRRELERLVGRGEHTNDTQKNRGKKDEEEVPIQTLGAALAYAAAEPPHISGAAGVDAAINAYSNPNYINCSSTGNDGLPTVANNSSSEGDPSALGNFDFLFDDSQWLELLPFAENENLNQTLSELEKGLAGCDDAVGGKAGRGGAAVSVTPAPTGPVPDSGQEQAWIWGFDPLKNDVFAA